MPRKTSDVNENIAHQQPANVRIFPEWQLPSQPSPSLCGEHDAIWSRIWSVGVSCPRRIPSQLLLHP